MIAVEDGVGAGIIVKLKLSAKQESVIVAQIDIFPGRRAYRKQLYTWW